MARAQRFGELLARAALDPVVHAEHFAARRQQVAAAHVAARQAIADGDREIRKAAIEKGKLDEEALGVNAELRSLQERKSNIPMRDLELRMRLRTELRLTEESLPFAGELIAVRDEEADWEGAAERLLRGFALSVLVPERHYAAVSDWIDGHRPPVPVGHRAVPDHGRPAPAHRRGAGHLPGPDSRQPRPGDPPGTGTRQLLRPRARPLRRCPFTGCRELASSDCWQWR